MTRTELVSAVAESTGITKAKTEAVIKALGDTINIEVRAGRDVALPGVGKFSRGERGARVGRNVRTGEAVNIAARCVVKFRPEKGFKEAVA